MAAAKNQKLQFIIITGLSGAGRSEAVRCFEDMGYFCIDNIPPALISKVADLCSLPGSKIKNVAIVCDVRGGEFFDTLADTLLDLKQRKIGHTILFLEASQPELVKRFKETRRRHPLAEGGQVLDGIKRERKLMEPLRGAADIVMDTTDLEAHHLRDKIRTTFLSGQQFSGLLITVVSFGFKFGVPLDADLVMDVRFLPNPHYVEKLRHFSGLDPRVRSFVLRRAETKAFLKRFLPLLADLIPNYISEGKTHLTIAIGCTGGAHRSVTLAEQTAKFLRKEKYGVLVRHRDMVRELTADSQSTV